MTPSSLPTQASRILYVAYPLLPVSEESCGGAEQILLNVEAQMHSRGYDTTVAACEGSRVAGKLFSTGPQRVATDAFEQREEQHCERVVQLTRTEQFSLIHDHSGSFWRMASEVSVPVLATLHLPRTFYKEELFRSIPHNVYFNCVSGSQLDSFLDLPRMLGVVENGVAIERFPYAAKKDNYLLWLGRICPEKAPHMAIEAARRAGMKLIMAGQVYPFSYHQQYFYREIRPQLEAANGDVEFVEVPSFSQKVELLRCAKALVITSLAQETSSLVALEAQACGTPVVAFSHGALGEVVSHRHTGYLVRTLADMTAAIHDVERIWPEECRHWVESRFSASVMGNRYQELYARATGELSDAMLMAA